jgi:hypothetical protein
LLHAQAVHNVSDGTFLKDEKIQDIAATGFGDGVEGVRGCGSTRHERIMHAHMGICQQKNLARAWMGPPVQKYPAVALRNRLLKVNRTEAGKSTSGIGSGWELLNVNVRGLSVDRD